MNIKIRVFLIFSITISILINCLITPVTAEESVETFCGLDSMDNLDNVYSSSSSVTVFDWFGNAVMSGWGEEAYEDLQQVYPNVSYRIESGSSVGFDCFMANYRSDQRFGLYSSENGIDWCEVKFYEQESIFADNDFWVQISCFAENINGNYIKITFPDMKWNGTDFFLDNIRVIPQDIPDFYGTDSFVSSSENVIGNYTFSSGNIVNGNIGWIENENDAVFPQDGEYYERGRRGTGFIAYKAQSAKLAEFCVYQYEASGLAFDWKIEASDDGFIWNEIPFITENCGTLVNKDGVERTGINVYKLKCFNINSKFIRIVFPYAEWSSSINYVRIETQYSLGDCNSDGVICIRDLVHLKKILSGHSAVNPQNADVVIDSVLNSYDLTVFRKYLLGTCALGTIFSKNSLVVDGSFEKLSDIVSIDTENIINQSFMGFGLEMDPYIWVDLSDERMSQIKQWLEFANMGTIRTMTNTYLFCLGFDLSGEPVFVWDCVDKQGNQLKNSNGDYVDKAGNVINHNVKASNRLREILAFCEQNGIEAIIGDWGYPAMGWWNIYPGANYLDPNQDTIGYTDGKWQKILAGFAYRMKSEFPNAVKYFNQGNEVNLNSDHYNRNDWVSSIKLLYKEFKKKGIHDSVKILGPDGGFWQDLWLNDTLENLTNEVPILDYHYYYNINSVSSGNLENSMRLLKNTIIAKNPEKKLVIGEMGYSSLQNAAQITEAFGDGFEQFFVANTVADAMIQFTRAGVDSSVLWMADDATHVAWGRIPENYQTEEDIIWKYGGFWNSNGSAAGYPQQENPRPVYYTWSVMSRAFPKGCKIISSNNAINTAARSLAAVVQTEKGKQVSLALVNSSDEPFTVTFKANNIFGKADYVYYEYTEDSIPHEENLLPKAKEVLYEKSLRDGITVTIKGNGLAVLTNLDTDTYVEIPDSTRIVDNMYNTNMMFTHSGNLGFNSLESVPEIITGDVANDSYRYNGDDTRIHKNSAQSASVVYKLDGVKSFRLGLYNDVTAKGVRISVSSDGSEFIVAEHKILLKTHISDDLYYYLLAPKQNLENVNYIKIEILDGEPFNTVQLSYFEADSKPLRPLGILGMDDPVLCSAKAESVKLPEKANLLLEGQIPMSVQIKWRDELMSSDFLRYVNGLIENTNVTLSKKVLIKNNLTDTFDHFNKMYCYPKNIVQSGASQATFNGDQTQLVRTSQGDGSVVYRFMDARKISANVYLYNTWENAEQYLKVFVSEDGESFTEVKLNIKKITVNESDGVYGGGNKPDYILSEAVRENNRLYWPMYTFESDIFPQGTKYVKIVLCENSNTWLQQLSEINILS